MGDETIWRHGYPPEPWQDEDQEESTDQTHVQYGLDGLECYCPGDADMVRLWVGYADGGTCAAEYRRDHSEQWKLTGSDLGMLADDEAGELSFSSADDAVAFAQQWLHETGITDRRDFWSR